VVICDCQALHMPRRQTDHIGTSEQSCEICGHQGLAVVRSHTVRRGLARLKPNWDEEARTYRICSACGMRYRVERGEPI
jgi:hypothetical protein